MARSKFGLAWWQWIFVHILAASTVLSPPYSESIAGLFGSIVGALVGAYVFFYILAFVMIKLRSWISDGVRSVVSRLQEART